MCAENRRRCPEIRSASARHCLITEWYRENVVVIVVFAKGDKVKEALEAGADFAGNEELFEKVKGGWTDFDAVIATPDMMRDVGKLGKVLGPRGLMPTPKAGTVTNDVAKAVAEVKAGKNRI